MTKPNDDGLDALQKECSRALGRYTSVLRAACKALTAQKSVPISDQEQWRILAHRREESEAYELFMTTRRRLQKLLTAKVQHPPNKSA